MSDLDYDALTEAERIDLGRTLNSLLEDNSSGPLEWHPCEGCQNAPCPCSGTTYLGPEMTAAVDRILAERATAAEAAIKAEAFREAAEKMPVVHGDTCYQATQRALQWLRDRAAALD